MAPPLAVQARGFYHILFRGALGVFFVIAGLPKVRLHPVAREMFAGWGYPEWLVVPVGLAEILGGVALLVPGYTARGALLLGAVMVGAAATHAVHGEWDRLVAPGLLLVVLAVLRRWPHPRAARPQWPRRGNGR